MAVKTNKLAETIKSDLAITVGIYSWETSYSLNQAHTSTVHTPHQTRWIQIIWQIFWKFLINQIRIFNFTFCVPSLFFLCVCAVHPLTCNQRILWRVFFSLCTSAVDVWNTAAIVRLKYAESPVYRFYHSLVRWFVRSPSHFHRERTEK